LRNRFTNTYATLSFQPIYGGPAYAIRNVLVNVADEQFKLHSLGGMPTVGAVIYHTTVIRGVRALQCSTSFEPQYFTIENSAFVGPQAIADGYTVRWDVPSVATAHTDYNGYAPDGQFELGYGSAGTTYASFDDLRAAGVFERHGTLLGTVSGIDDWTVALDPMTPMLAPTSPAVDHAALLPNIDDAFAGNGADLGAIEVGCEPPIYGPRPIDIDENEPLGCVPPPSLGDDIAHGDDPAGSGGSHGGGCCQGAPGASNFALVLVVVVALRRRYKRRPSDTSRDVSIR
ncbi:MAG: hypothetical protein ABUU24_09670, partial [Variovorax sp.]